MVWQRIWSCGVVILLLTACHSSSEEESSMNNFSAEAERSSGQGLRINLVDELQKSFVSGGDIKVVAEEGRYKAYRIEEPPSSMEEELAIREKAWRIFEKLNLAKPGEVDSGSLAITNDQREKLRAFSLSKEGAIWIREVVNDDIIAFNKGYFEVIDEASALKLFGRSEDLSIDQLVTGELSDDGVFADDLFLLKVHGYSGYGASATRSLIGLGIKGFRENFTFSGQLVDPHAIYSHEFGHTEYGNPNSITSILGETETVENYENPVRIKNGFDPREKYCSRKYNQCMLVENKDTHDLPVVSDGVVASNTF